MKNEGLTKFQNVSIQGKYQPFYITVGNEGLKFKCVYFQRFIEIGEQNLNFFVNYAFACITKLECKFEYDFSHMELPCLEIFR